jgi:hypothetical protein
MFKLIGIGILILLLLIGVEYMVTSATETATYKISTITVTDKYTMGMTYVIKTVSLEQFVTTPDIYNEMEIGRTYIAKTSNNKIVGLNVV